MGNERTMKRVGEIEKEKLKNAEDNGEGVNKMRKNKNERKERRISKSNNMTALNQIFYFKKRGALSGRLIVL